jgi:hypothetical protein
VRDKPDRNRQSGRHEVVGEPEMPAVRPESLWRSPNFFPNAGQRYTIGWQDLRKAGPCFLVVRDGVFGERILDRFPMTPDGWSRTWAALAKLDAGAAQAVAKVLKERQRQEAAEDRQRLLSVPHSLDPECFDLLRRAWAAEDTILAFYARAGHLLDAPVDLELLADNVREVLAAGKKISNLRAQHSAIAEKSMPTPGSMTAAVLEPQKKALAMALSSVTSRVENLEHYASSVTAVDRTYRDWVGAQEAERLNDPVRDILAETLRDEFASEELRGLADRADTAEEAFRLSIHEADLAGETLALPDG